MLFWFSFVASLQCSVFNFWVLHIIFRFLHFAFVASFRTFAAYFRIILFWALFSKPQRLDKQTPIKSTSTVDVRSILFRSQEVSVSFLLRLFGFVSLRCFDDSVASLSIFRLLSPHRRTSANNGEETSFFLVRNMFSNVLFAKLRMNFIFSATQLKLFCHDFYLIESKFTFYLLFCSTTTASHFGSENFLFSLSLFFALQMETTFRLKSSFDSLKITLYSNRFIIILFFLPSNQRSTVRFIGKVLFDELKLIQLSQNDSSIE